MASKKAVLVGGILIFVFLVASFLHINHNIGSKPTGAVIVANPGTITGVNITQQVNPSYWSFAYGFLQASSESEQNFTSGDLIQVNISTTKSLVNTTIVVASPSPSINISNLVVAPTTILDGLLGLGPAHRESATNTFTELVNITIGNQTYEVNSLVTNSVSGTYRTSFFLSNSNPVFITHFQNETGFNNESSHYQLLLPQLNSTSTYYFSVYEYADLVGGVVTCLDNFIVDAYVASDDESIIIYWNETPGALNYNLYYADGLDQTNNTLIFNGSQLISATTLTNYTDNTTSLERYYVVEANMGVGSCVSNTTAATFLINMSPSTANLISFPLLFRNNSIEEITRPISSSFTALNGFDNQLQTFGFYIKFGNSIFQNFNTIDLGTGYWITLNDSVDLRIAGQLTQDFNETVYNASNLIGFPVIQGNNSVAYTLRSIDGGYSALNGFDNLLQTFDFYIIFGNSVFSNFNEIKPTVGYWLTTNETGEIILP